MKVTAKSAYPAAIDAVIDPGANATIGGPNHQNSLTARWRLLSAHIVD
jgi:hypothetical protein